MVTSDVKYLKIDNIIIEHHSGYKFLKFIFNSDVDEIIDFIKYCINKYD